MSYFCSVCLYQCQKMKRKGYKAWLSGLLLMMCAQSVCGQTSDDKVVIEQQSDAYAFSFKDGHSEVCHTRRTDYSLNSQVSQTVHPFVYYDDCIRLDRASCTGAKAQHQNVTQDDVFFDGTKVCFFTGTLTQRRPRLTADFQRTFTDGRYLTHISLAEEYFVRRRAIVFTIPLTLRGIRLVPVNCDDCQMTVQATATKSDSVFTFTLTNLAAPKREQQMPPSNLSRPYLLVLGAFSDHHDLYRWSHRLTQIDTDIPDIGQILQEANRGAATPEERLRNTYSWVQRNIRYVAYEAGIAGHQPDRPAEVVRKRYGDCKGMAMLLRTLLRAQGFDARLAYVGTDDIPYPISQRPSLAAVNHVVCQTVLGDSTYWLDATFRYTPADYVPQAIQGQEAMVENGDDCRMVRVPLLPVTASVDSLSYSYELADDLSFLRGRATYMLSGDMKEYFMSIYERLSAADKIDFLSHNLNADDHNHAVSDATWSDAEAGSQWAVFGGQVKNTHSVQLLDGDIYVELNPHNNIYATRIDTLKRQSDVYLPVLCNAVRRVELRLPANVVLTHLPRDFEVTLPHGRLSCSFEYAPEQVTVVFLQRMHITSRLLRRADIAAWNTALARWQDACNEQIMLKRITQETK